MSTRDRIKITFSVVLGLALILALTAQVMAEAQKEEKVTKITKQVTGEIAGISKNFIAVDYGLNAQGTSMQEMAFNLDKNIKIEHKRSLAELYLGDTVTVTYEEITKTDKQGGKWVNCIPKVITFVRPAQKSLESIAPQEAATQEENIPLKGIKGE